MKQAKTPVPVARISAGIAVALALIVGFAAWSGRSSGERPPKESVRTAGAVGNRGEAIFERVCRACHLSGAAGAPRLGSEADWAPRIARGMGALLQSAQDGKGAMPPRGTCADCTDEQLKAAIAFMVSRVR